MITVTKVDSEYDFQALVQDIDSALWVPASEITAGDYTAETLREYVDNPSNVLFVGYLDNIFAGMASAHLLTRPDREKWLYVDAVDTVADKQKKGVGTGMMRSLQEYSQSQGCDEMWLGTELDNQPAQALYRSLTPDDIENFTGFTYKVKR